jgi:hypothetical protein
VADGVLGAGAVRRDIVRIVLHFSVIAMLLAAALIAVWASSGAVSTI